MTSAVVHFKMELDPIEFSISEAVLVMGDRRHYVGVVERSLMEAARIQVQSLVETEIAKYFQGVKGDDWERLVHHAQD